jgi:hypothetical protein
MAEVRVDVVAEECRSIAHAPRAGYVVEVGHFIGCRLDQLSNADVTECMENKSYSLRSAARTELERRGVLWPRRWRKEL